MKSTELRTILQAPYEKNDWKRVLQFLDQRRQLLTLHLQPRELEISSKTNQKTVKSFREIGRFKTADGVELPLFEIELQSNIQIDRNRVGVNEFIKNHIVRDGQKGALTTFFYENQTEKPEWRFSFISKNSASEFFAEAEDKETNPKRFTYIFGNQERHKTAVEQLTELAQSNFDLDDFFTAFNVAPVSERFFEEYEKFHNEIADFLLESKYSGIFEKHKDPDTELGKEVRSFASRLMGRLTFLYFLQKKHWLGATATDYQDGSPTFLSDLFAKDPNRQDDFYHQYLCPLFFNALNNPNRENDTFTLANGETFCVPFLNGGLFEENQEPEGHRNIKLRSDLFEDLFAFFDSYNFTVYENSPEEHTIAVDPEMLGHIFENLIEYNKDTGAYYTPKEIVQYMTQESLMEYLKTHIPEKDKAIAQLIKNQNATDFSESELGKIDNLINEIKICDPAVGSGAFPMGMMQELFNLKSLIHFQIGQEEDWNPAAVKQNIIQNSIYGVDLDKGAVDIARLRFWLSLVVDEEKPQPLPNLDYKLMQGNSLVESFRGIDLSNLGRIDEPVLDEQQVLNFDDEYSKVSVFDAVSLDRINALINEYFETGKASNRPKKQVKKEIDNIVEGKIHTRITYEREVLTKAVEDFYQKYGIREESEVEDLKANSKDVKKFYRDKNKLEELKQNEQELIDFQDKTERPYFLWHLFFNDVLENGGFDIVIGNPPYIKEYTNRNAFDEFREMSKEYYRGKMDIWYGFASISLDLLKENGVECFIAQNNWVTSAGASKLRRDVLNRTEIKQFIDFGNYKVFVSAGIQTMIYLLQKKKKPANCYETYYASLQKDSVNEYQLKQFLDRQQKTSKENLFEKYTLDFKPVDFKNKYIAFIRPSVQRILERIKKEENYKLNKKEVAQGIVAPQDKLNKSAVSKLNGNYKKNDGVFVLNDIEKRSINFSENELNIIKPFYGTKQLGRFVKTKENKNWIIYAESDINSKIELFPNIKKHLDQFQNILTSSNKPYGLHRARDPYFFEDKKIMSLRKCEEPTFTYTNFSCYVSQSFFVIKPKDICLKYLTLFLNSRIIAFWLRYKGKMQGNNYQVDKKPLMNIPIYKPKSYSPFIELFELITTALTAENRIIEVIDNQHIADFFEEVTNACFFDVYFEEEMKEKDISVIDEISNKLKEFNINEEFESLEEDIKREKIAGLYPALKNSKAQQKIRRFITSSPDILKPILQN